MPDDGNAHCGPWQLGCVYEAGRFVTVRCEYADGASSDLVLANRVERCDDRLDAKKALDLNCR